MKAKQEWEEAMEDCLIETAANMGYLDLQADHNGWPNDAPDCQQVWLSVYQPICISFSLLADRSVLQEMIENVWLIETDKITSHHEEDLLAELANTVVGRVMSRMTEAGETFDLGLPRISVGSPLARDYECVVQSGGLAKGLIAFAGYAEKLDKG